jgi:hypothetical protein
MGSEAQADKRLAAKRTLLGAQPQDPAAGPVRRALAVLAAHPYLSIFVLAMLVRIVTAGVLSRYFSGSLVLDDGTYWDMARDVATGRTSEWIPYTHALYSATLAFTFPLSLVYRLFGPAQLSGQIMVALLGSGTAVLVAALVKEKLAMRFAVAAGLIIALLPSQILWSSLILKDAAVWFVLATLALLVAHAGRADSRALWVITVLILLNLVVIAYLRDHTLVVACWALMLSAWVGQKNLRGRRIAAGIVLGITVPWLMGLGPAGATFVSDAGSIDDLRAVNAGDAETAIVPSGENTAKSNLQQTQAEKQSIAERMDQISQKLAALTSKHGKTPEAEKKRKARIARLKAEQAALAEQLATASSVETKGKEKIASIEGAKREPGVKHLARGISVMLAEPYPWDPGDSPSFRMAQAETLVWYPVLLLALLGLAGALRALRVTLFPLLFGGGVMLVYALVEGNVGTAYRHRGEFVWVVALLAAFGLVFVGRAIERRRTRAGETPTEMKGTV